MGVNHIYPQYGTQKEKQIWRYESLQEIKKAVSELASGLHLYRSDTKIPVDLAEEYKKSVPESMARISKEVIELARYRHGYTKTLCHPYFRRGRFETHYAWFIIYADSLDICLGYVGDSAENVFTIKDGIVYVRYHLP